MASSFLCAAESLIQLRPPDSQWRREILEAIRVQQHIGAKPELARSYASYARLLEITGEIEQAKTQLLQAIDMFRGLDMAWDLGRAEQALRDLA